MVWSVFWGLVMTPIFIKTLGKSDYGIWLLIHALVGYYGLLDLGVRSAVVRYVSRALALKDIRTVNETLNTAFVLYGGMGVVALGLSVALAVILPDVSGFAAGQHPDAAVLILLVGANMAVAFPGRLLEGVLSAAERFDLSNLLRIIFSFIRNMVFIVLLFSGYGLLALAWALLALTSLEKIVVALVVLRKVPSVRLNPKLARRSRVREIFDYGIHTFLAQSGNRLRLFTDSIVIGAFLPPQAITLFNIGNRPVTYLTRMTMGIARVLTPAFSRTEAHGRVENLRRLLILGTRATTILTWLACLILAVLGDRLIRLWVGEGFGESVQVLLLLLPAYLFANGMHPTSSILYGTSRHRVLSIIVITEGLANLGLSLLFIRMWGIVGVALGTAIPMLIARLFVVPIYACRTIQLPYRTFIREALGPAVVPFIGAGLLAHLLKHLIPGQDVGSVVLLGGIITVTYVTLTALVLLVRDDELLPGVLRTRIPGLADPDKRAELYPRILLIAYRFPPQGGGGVQRSAKMVKAWRKRGVAVAVLTAPAGAAKLRDPTLLDEVPSGVPRAVAHDPSLPILFRSWRRRLRPRLPVLSRLLVAMQWMAQRVSIPDATGGWFFPGLWKGWRVYRKLRPDAILVTGPPWTPYLVGGILSRLTATPLVLDYRDPWTASYISVRRGGLGPMVSPLLERIILRCASGVVSAHRAVFRRLGPMIAPGTPRLWAPNGYDPEDFAAPSPDESDGEVFTLTYTGGFFRWRSPETLFRVLEDLIEEGALDPARFRLVLAGSVGQAVRSFLQGSRLAGVVTAKGYLPHRESIRLLQKSTLNLVLEGELGGPNLHTPGKFYEVLYSGRPVLLLCPDGTTTTLARRVGGCAIAHPNDAAAIRAHILDLYEAWSQGRSLPMPNRDSFLFYDRNRQADRLLEFLQRVSFSRAGSPPSRGASAAVLG